MYGGSVDDGWLEDWLADGTARAEQATRLARRVGELTATAHGLAGAVEVTVDGSGAVTDLWLGERIRTITPGELAAEIVATIRRAQGLLVERVRTAVGETVGADTESGRAVLASFTGRFIPDDRSGPHGVQ